MCSTRVQLILLLAISSSLKCTASNGMYSIVPAKIEIKYDRKYLSEGRVTFVSTGPRDILVNGSINLIQQFPPEVITKIVVQKANGKKYTDVGPPLQRNICDFIKNEKMIYPDVLNYSNFPKSCPIAPKEYHVINYKLPVQFLPPILPLGNYKTIVQHKLKNDILYEVAIFGEIKQL